MSDISEIKFAIETTLAPQLWYPMFSINPSQIIRMIETLQVFPGIYANNMSVPYPYEENDFNSEVWEDMGITFMAINLPMERGEIGCSWRLYFLFTKTEDGSYDCPQYYCSKVLERGHEIFFVGYDLKPESCGKVLRLDDEEGLLVELYFQNAMSVRGDELKLRKISDGSE